MSAQSRALIEASQTLGAAYLAGLQPHAKYQCRNRMEIVKVEPCGYDAMLDLESLIWTRGAKYPCWRLAQRLKCPRCGGMSIEVAWVPGASPAARRSRDLYQCVVVAGQGG
jgi:hypothetical protein